MSLFTKPGLSHPTTIGGTGICIDQADPGTLFIGDGTGFNLTTLTSGAGVSIVNGPGTIQISATGTYALPIASASVLGGIKVGANLAIDGSGVLSGTASYVLPIASASVLGGVKQGSNVTIDGAGVLSVSAPYVLPIASASVLGGIKVGTGLSIDGSGVLSSIGGAVTSAVEYNLDGEGLVIPTGVQG